MVNQPYVPKPRTHLSGFFLLGLLTLVLNRTGIDQAVTNLFYDPASQTFPLRETWLMSSVLHAGLRNLSALLWLGLTGWLFYLLVRHKWGKKPEPTWCAPVRSTLLWLVPTLLAAAALTAGFKSQSLHSCPWDLQAYGGQADFIYLLQSVLPEQNTGPGKCFPSGHASSGWMWIALLFVPGFLKARQVEVPTWAIQTAWFSVLVFGAVTSFAQVIRGAHFVSHTTATAAVCWAVAWVGATLAHRYFGAKVSV